LSGVLSELKPGVLQIVFGRIRRRVHDRELGLLVPLPLPPGYAYAYSLVNFSVKACLVACAKTSQVFDKKYARSRRETRRRALGHLSPRNFETLHRNLTFEEAFKE